MQSCRKCCSLAQMLLKMDIMESMAALNRNWHNLSLPLLDCYLKTKLPWKVSHLQDLVSDIMKLQRNTTIRVQMTVQLSYTVRDHNSAFAKRNEKVLSNKSAVRRYRAKYYPRLRFPFIIPLGFAKNGKIKWPYKVGHSHKLIPFCLSTC